MSTKWISDEGETSVRKESINCGHEAQAGGEVRAPPVRLGGGRGTAAMAGSSVCWMGESR